MCVKIVYLYLKYKTYIVELKPEKIKNTNKNKTIFYQNKKIECNISVSIQYSKK